MMVMDLSTLSWKEMHKLAYEKDKRITGEYDPPLSERNPNPTKADLQKAEEIAEKYRQMKAERLGK